jgi:hypothetical protein
MARSDFKDQKAPSDRRAPMAQSGLPAPRALSGRRPPTARPDLRDPRALSDRRAPMARPDLPARRVLWDQRAPMALSDLRDLLAGPRSMLALVFPEAWSSPLTQLHPSRLAGESVPKEDIARQRSASCSGTSGPEDIFGWLRESFSLSVEIRCQITARMTGGESVFPPERRHRSRQPPQQRQ